MSLKRIDITGVPIDNLTYEGFLGRIEGFISSNRKAYVVTVNPEMILNASIDDEFSEVLQASNVNTADGIGVLWAAYYLSLPFFDNVFKNYFQLLSSLAAILFSLKKIKSVLNQRITGSDLLPKLVEYSQDRYWKIYLLGASKGVARRAKQKLVSLYPQASIVGYYEGSPHKRDEDEICDLVNEAKPDILFVAYGSPSQELWIHRNLFKLNSVKVAIGVGGSFDFYGGKIKRAPKLMQKLGLEWLWRLFREPSRIKRIWNATYRFIKLVFKEKTEIQSG